MKRIEPEKLGRAVSKAIIKAIILFIFYLIFDYISRNWGLTETRRFLYFLIMILYLWKDN